LIEKVFIQESLIQAIYLEYEIIYRIVKTHLIMKEPNLMTVTKSHLNKVMHDRKSVRKYDENYKIPQAQLKELLEEATSAPSSSNLQPWRFFSHSR